MKETDLITEKTQRMTVDELHEEIERCERGCVVAASISALKRFKTRIALLKTELERRKA